MSKSITKTLVQEAIEHLDPSSREAFAEIGKALFSGESPRARICYAEESSSREKRLLLDFVGDNEFVGTVVSMFVSKDDNLCLRMKDYAREEIQRPGEPVMMTMRVTRITNVVKLRARSEEPSIVRKEAAPAPAKTEAPANPALKKRQKDDHGGEKLVPISVARKPCRRCGNGGLHWAKMDGKFRLCTAEGVPHRCTAVRA